MTPGPLAIERFLEDLARPTPKDVFNPWTMHDPGTDIDAAAPLERIHRLRQHLCCSARFVLIGEAPGYQGCHVTGIPFTSERLLLKGAIPRVTVTRNRLSTRQLPWSEPSATIVWSTLYELGMAESTVLWNAYPWHPHKPGNTQSNRTPTKNERVSGEPFVRGLLELYPGAKVFAVGRQCQKCLSSIGVIAPSIRHPAMGGAEQFKAQLRLHLRAGSFHP